MGGIHSKGGSKILVWPGQRYGMLMVIAHAPSTVIGKGAHKPTPNATPRRSTSRQVWVKCDCGQIVTKTPGNLRSGGTTSCGCRRRALADERRMERTLNCHGYAMIRRPDHPRARRDSGKVLEHIVVMEEMLGRHLLPGEEVHHKNRVRDDNRPSNLELWARSHPAGGRVIDLVAWAIELLVLYAPDRLVTATATY